MSAVSNVRKILVIKWSAMGDVAIASAGIEDIARAHPDAALHLSTLPPWDRLFASDSRLSKVLCIDVRGPSQFSAMRRWLRAVANERYDLVIDLQTTDRSRLLLSCLWLMRAQIPYRVGNKSAFPYNLAPHEPPLGRHAMAQLGLTLGVAGIAQRTPRPVLHCSGETRGRSEQLLESRGVVVGEYAVFLPGSQSAGYIKRWGAGRFVRLAHRLRNKGVPRIVVLGGPDEIDECARIAADCGDWLINLCGATELLDIVPICEGAQFVVGNDTGTAHVAAAAARQMVIICGPTDPLRVLPAGDNVTSIQADLPCINCYRKHCAHHTCMAWITPRNVVEKLEALGAVYPSPTSGTDLSTGF